jgi:hypothetical protein
MGLKEVMKEADRAIATLSDVLALIQQVVHLVMAA